MHVRTICTLTICALTSFVALAIPSGARADWPAYLNGNDRAGFTAMKLDPALRLAWSYRSPVKPEMAWSGPRETPIEGHVMKHRVNFDDAFQVVIGSDRVYFGSTVDHSLHCVDAQSGAPQWTFYTDGPIRLAPTLAHGNVYFGSDDGFVYCLAADDGHVVWKMRVGPQDDRLLSRGEMISRWPVRTGVLIDGNRAYFGAGVFPHETVYLCAVDALDGSVIWRNDTISEQDAGRNDLSPQGYLLANEDYLYVPSGRSLPVAFSKATGEIVFQRTHSWRTDAGGVVGGTKAVLGDGQVYSGGPHHFLAMDEKTGNVGEAWITGRQMVLADDRAYLLDGERIFCVNRQEHSTASQEKQKWFLKARELQKDPAKLAEAKQKMEQYMDVGILWETPSDFDDVLIACDNLVFAGGMNEVVALDRASGQRVWNAQVDGNVRGLAIDENLLTVSTDDGRVYAFRNDGPVDAATDTVAQWPESYTAPFPADPWTEYYRSAAEQILQRSGQRSGYCLVLGSDQGRLAYELAQQSELTIYAVEPDAEQAARSRERLDRAGIHATRITVIHASIDDLPFSNYFANLIVSDSMLTTGRLPGDPEKISRHLKPCGGVVIIGRPAGGPDTGGPDTGGPGTGGRVAKSPVTADDMTAWLTQFYQREEGEVIASADWQMLRRGKLAGAGNWSHQYGNAANTSFSDDQRIRDGLGVLWYGDPGPSAMINRHEAAGAPLSTNGRMFIQGTDRLMAYDAYNGTFLWEFENPGAIRTGVFNNRETHNLAASDDALYVAIENQCLQIDAATGQVNATYQTPPSSDGVERAWAYLAYDQGQLFGTSTIREELEEKMRRRGLTVKSQTDALFAIDTASGQRTWTYRGSNILHTTIAVGPERIYFIDSSLTPQERQQLYLKDKSDLAQLTGAAAEKAEAEMKQYDVRLAVALDRRTGEKIWEKAVDVTDTTDISAGGGSLTLMVADGHIVLCGANANGHYWKQFLAGEFDRRKLVVLDAADGKELWSKNANYMNRPAIVGDDIYAEPWAFKLHSGEPKLRPHPLTGDNSQWRFSRPGHHCGVITATPNMMFFRSGFIGYYDLYQDSGTRHFAGQRLGCWVNAIPGNGLVMIPEASAGCVCQFSIASTVVMEPKSENKSWGIFSAVGPTTPVARIGINFGAPGDRKDISGSEWFGYPRPKSVERLEFVFDLKPKLSSGGGWYNRNLESVSITESDKPWVFTSGARGLSRFEIPLLGKDDAKANYDVKFMFANLETQDTGSFSIKLQSQVVQSDIVIAASHGTSVAPQTIEFSDVAVTDSLLVELVPDDPARLPILSGIEVKRRD